MGNLIHTILGIFLSAVKAFFSAIVQIAWGIASFFLLMSLLTYYKADPTAIANLIPIMEFIQQNWIWFFWVIAIFEFALNLKEWLKPVQAETLLIQTPQAIKSKEKQL